MNIKTLCLVVLALLAGVTLAAQQPESLTQMGLAQSTQFRTRLVYVLLQEARVVKAEPLATACHYQRSTYANGVLANAPQAAADAAPLVVGGVNLIGTVVANPAAALVDSSATDAAILSQVATFWNVLSRCDTGT